VEQVSVSLLTDWHSHLDALIGLALLQGLYLLGIGPLREKYNLADSVDPRQIATFTAGVVVLFFALLSPIHDIGDKYLFSMHMLQHMLFIFVAPPLLILGTPDWLLRPLLRPNPAFRAARILVHPVFAFFCFNMLFSLWHIPSLYNLTAVNQGVHITEHIMFITVSILMWWPVTSVMPELPRLSYPLQMGYLFFLTIPPIILFGALTFADHAIYSFYATAPKIWGFTPLLDQQVGGILMKVGGGALFLALFIVIFFKWFNEEERKRKAEAAERERYYDYYYPPDESALEDNPQ
jgi:putative membrane protein